MFTLLTKNHIYTSTQQCFKLRIAIIDRPYFACHFLFTMAESQSGDGGSGTRRSKGTNVAKRAIAGATTHDVSVVTPCGACKFLRRKCSGGCIFAPYFGTDQGAARFAAVHKVFGASNVSKLLANIPTDHRQEAATTISYEAQARLSDPVYGCVSTILALQQQV